MSPTHEALVGLTIQKRVDSRKPSDAVIEIDIYDVGRVEVVLDEHQFVLLLGATHVPNVPVKLTFEPTPEQKAEKATAIELLTKLKDEIPAGHRDKGGVLRAIEILRVMM